MIRVFITDDHEIYLEGLALLLGKQEGIEVIGTAASGKELLDQVRDLQADVLLLDVYLPDLGEGLAEAEIRAMIDVDLLAPILLTQAALPKLRESGEGLVINVASGIALIGMPFYTTYAAVKAGLSRFGEALRRELVDEGVHVMTVYPGATDTPMMQTSKAGPDLGFVREPASAVAEAILDGIRTNAFEVIRGGQARAEMIARNREDPAALDRRFAGLKSQLAEAVRDHSAL